MSTFTLRITKIITDEVRRIFPNKIIILGGVHLNHSPEDFKYFKADYGLRGDCEFELKKLIKCIELNKDPTDIKGIIYPGQESINEPAYINNGLHPYL